MAISASTMQKLGSFITWSNNVANMKKIDISKEEGLEISKPKNKYYRFTEYLSFWTKKLFDQNALWSESSLFKLHDDWFTKALNIVNKKEAINDLPCLSSEDPNFDTAKDQIYGTFLPVYRAIKESFDKRWGIEFLFNHRQYTAERDALKALKLLMRSVTRDKEEAFEQRYNDFLYEIPTANAQKLNEIYQKRERDAEINENVKQVVAQAEQDRMEREQLEEDLAKKLKEEQDLKNAEIQEKAVDDLTAEDQYTILTGDPNFMGRLEKEVVEAVGNPSKKALKTIMSKSALRGAMEIAEKLCKNYTGDRKPLEDGAKEMFAKVHNIIGALGYPTLKDELIAVQKITDIVLKSATPCGFYEKEHGDIASGFVVNDNDAVKDIIKNNQKNPNKNYTDEEIETAITEAKAMSVKKEIVNIDFGKDNSQLSSPVSQSAKQIPIADKK